jgi:hypothetical protein
MAKLANFPFVGLKAVTALLSSPSILVLVFFLTWGGHSTYASTVIPARFMGYLLQTHKI